LFFICDDIAELYLYYKRASEQYKFDYNKNSIQPHYKKSNLNINFEDILVIPQYGFEKIEQDDSLNDKVSPLDVTLKSQYERALNADFSNVKIHTGELAEHITREANAEAVTIGEDIYFAGEKWSPDTEEGQSLSAHELQHIKQYQQNRRFVYLEDIWEVEKEAGIVENKIKKLKLHEIQSPILDVGDIDVRNEIIPKKEIETLSQTEFIKNEDKPLFEIYFSNSNKKYLITAEEKQKAIEFAIEKLNRDINEEISCMTENDRENYLLKLMKCIL
jgi:hypothetical protein